MGKRERYEPGIFCWVDLSTNDADGAKVFYGELFGWEFEDNEIPGGGVYTMCHVRGDTVAAIVQQDEQPGHWNNYVTVMSADETAAKAKQLGANVFEKPFDVMESGRMAVFADPGGAILCVWQPREHIGARRVNDAGCMAWNELQTREPETAVGFYSALFGWKAEPIEQDGATVYVTIENQAGWMNGGFMPMTDRQGDTPSFWLTYFTVPSCDDALAREGARRRCAGRANGTRYGQDRRRERPAGRGVRRVRGRDGRIDSLGVQQELAGRPAAFEVGVGFGGPFERVGATDGEL